MVTWVRLLKGKSYFHITEHAETWTDDSGGNMNLVSVVTKLRDGQ